MNLIDLELRIRALARTYPGRSGGYSYIEERNQPCCIVGEAAKTLVSSEEIHRWVVMGRIRMIQSCRPEMIYNGRLDWIQRVQEIQDQGHAWGKALERADEEMRTGIRKEG